jgi:hypothetical protein
VLLIIWSPAAGVSHGVGPGGSCYCSSDASSPLLSLQRAVSA